MISFTTTRTHHHSQRTSRENTYGDEEVDCPAVLGTERAAAAAATPPGRCSRRCDHQRAATLAAHRRTADEQRVPATQSSTPPRHPHPKHTHKKTYTRQAAINAGRALTTHTHTHTPMSVGPAQRQCNADTTQKTAPALEGESHPGQRRTGRNSSSPRMPPSTHQTTDIPNSNQRKEQPETQVEKARAATTTFPARSGVQPSAATPGRKGRRQPQHARATQLICWPLPS